MLGVPVSAPLTHLDEQIVLAIRKPRGLALEEFLNANPEPKTVAKILRFALTSIEQIYARGLALCNCDVSELESSFEPNEGEMLSGKYTLEERLSTTQSSETWSAKHNDGQFDCVIEIVSEAEARSNFGIRPMYSDSSL